MNAVLNTNVKKEQVELLSLFCQYIMLSPRHARISRSVTLGHRLAGARLSTPTAGPLGGSSSLGSSNAITTVLPWLISKYRFLSRNDLFVSSWSQSQRSAAKYPVNSQFSQRQVLYAVRQLDKMAESQWNRLLRYTQAPTEHVLFYLQALLYLRKSSRLFTSFLLSIRDLCRILFSTSFFTTDYDLKKVIFSPFN
jgi:hypothetical protein